MKLVKMSLVAAMVMGASAFALDNVKVSGDAKLYYGTDDNGQDLFEQGTLANVGSYADTAVRLGVTGDLTKGVSFGTTVYAVSTLGLENNLVSNTWTGAHSATGNGSSIGAAVNDAWWVGEAWMAATLGKTTAKIGRMELDTPLAFTEKWSIVPNTFEAAVLINQDIPDTTLVGAWVGKGNGTNALHHPMDLDNNPLTPNTPILAGSYTGAVGIDGVVAADANFNTFMKDGAYAAAVVNNSYKPLTAQAWYYNVVDVADAYWLQADVNCKLLPGVVIGAQYAEMSPKGALEALVAGIKDSSAYAVKLGYNGVPNLKVSAAYSDVDEKGVLQIANVATNNLGAPQSKLYTETFWSYGHVGAVGAEAMNLTAEYDIKDIAKVGAYYTYTNQADDMNEAALTASKSFGPLDATLAYINTDIEGVDSVNAVQAYLTLNF